MLFFQIKNNICPLLKIKLPTFLIVNFFLSLNLKCNIKPEYDFSLQYAILKR